MRTSRIPEAVPRENRTHAVDTQLREILSTRRGPTDIAWIVHAVLSHHPHVEGEDEAWYRVCAYEYVRDRIAVVMSTLKYRGA